MRTKVVMDTSCTFHMLMVFTLYWNLHRKRKTIWAMISHTNFIKLTYSIHEIIKLCRLSGPATLPQTFLIQHFSILFANLKQGGVNIFYDMQIVLPSTNTLIQCAKFSCMPITKQLVIA